MAMLTGPRSVTIQYQTMKSLERGVYQAMMANTQTLQINCASWSPEYFNLLSLSALVSVPVLTHLRIHTSSHGRVIELASAVATVASHLPNLESLVISSDQCVAAVDVTTWDAFFTRTLHFPGFLWSAGTVLVRMIQTCVQTMLTVYAGQDALGTAIRPFQRLIHLELPFFPLSMNSVSLCILTEHLDHQQANVPFVHDYQHANVPFVHPSNCTLCRNRWRKRVDNTATKMLGRLQRIVSSMELLTLSTFFPEDFCSSKHTYSVE